MKKLGLAICSGGARGVAHIGFLEALEEAGIRADYVSGCSMGSIVGACYCAGVPLDVVKERILSLKLSHVAALNVNPIRSNGLFKFTKARKLIEEYIPPETTFADLKIPFTCVATDLVSGVTVKKLGAEVIVAVDVLGDLTAIRAEPPKNIVDTLLRYVDIVDTRITQRKQSMRRKSIDLWLEPDLGDMSQYKVKNLDFACERGYELGRANAEKIRALLEEDAPPTE